MDPATDKYYRWLTVIALPVFYNLMMLITRYSPSLSTSHPLDNTIQTFTFIFTYFIFQSLFQ